MKVYGYVFNKIHYELTYPYTLIKILNNVDRVKNLGVLVDRKHLNPDVKSIRHTEPFSIVYHHLASKRNLQYMSNRESKVINIGPLDHL